MKNIYTDGNDQKKKNICKKTEDEPRSYRIWSCDISL
jgi:hypothetical protein